MAGVEAGTLPPLTDEISSSLSTIAVEHGVQLVSMSFCGTYIETLVELGDNQYEIVVCPTSDANAVMDPSNLERYFAPNTALENPPVNSQHPYQVVIPIQANGSCVAGCQFCKYGAQDSGPFIDSEIAQKLFQTGIDWAQALRLIEGDEQVKLSFLKGGDVSFHPDLAELLGEVMSTYPDNRLKLSSIAAKNRNFFQQLLGIPTGVDLRKISLQLSVNSTDKTQRNATVNGGRPGNIQVYSLEEIAEFAAQWKVRTGRRVTLTHTLHTDSIFDPDTIIEKFNHDDVVIKMRRLHPQTGNGLAPIEKRRYEEAYQKLVDGGFDVIIGNPTASEIEHNLSTRRNYQS